MEGETYKSKAVKLLVLLNLPALILFVSAIKLGTSVFA
tara:strand:+ start:880 stop:993 length:114 start_codon:yes stop_codon:yes gene_type:complete